MLDVNYPSCAHQEGEESQSQLSQQNKDIVNFIGGSVLQKLKQRLVQQKDCTAKEEKLRCIDDMLEKEADDEASLTSTLNKGGLLFLKPVTKELFHLLEFKELRIC